MRYRLPLELELVILEFAAPPLVQFRLHARVDFFMEISLVHRSFTAWAQDRLHDLFNYTYRSRKDESARLERRLTEAGFGPSRPILRLYLDVTHLRRSDGIQLYGVDLAGPSETEDTVETRSSVNEGFQASEAPSELTHGGDVERTLELLFSSCDHSFDTLWLMPPYRNQVDFSHVPAPRLLIVDHEVFGTPWNYLHGLPLSQRTTLTLRKTTLIPRVAHCPVLNLILDQSRLQARADLLQNFPALEVLIACKSACLNSLRQFDGLPTSIRHIHILQSDFDFSREDRASATTLPALETLTFTWLQPDTTDEFGSHAADDADRSDPLSNLRRFVESSIVAPLCTFKYLRSTKTPEDALADAMAELGLNL